MIKKYKKVYAPSEQDMKDAWIIWLIVKSSVKSKSKKNLKLQDIYDRFENELRLMFFGPRTKGSPGMMIVERLYKSWEQKSMHAEYVNERIKNKEIDQMGAYVMVIVQTLMATMPHSRNLKSFHEERWKDVEEFYKRIDEWKELHDLQESEEYLKN